MVGVDDLYGEYSVLVGDTLVTTGQVTRLAKEEYRWRSGIQEEMRVWPWSKHEAYAPRIALRRIEDRYAPRWCGDES